MSSRPAAAPPVSVRVAQVICLVHALALGYLAVGLTIELAGGRTLASATVVLLLVVYVAIAALLVIVARLIGLGRSWPRGVLMTWWILAGISVLSIGLDRVVAVPAALTCLVGVVAMLWPTTRDYLGPAGGIPARAGRSR